MKFGWHNINLYAPQINWIPYWGWLDVVHVKYTKYHQIAFMLCKKLKIIHIIEFNSYICLVLLGGFMRWASIFQGKKFGHHWCKGTNSNPALIAWSEFVPLHHWCEGTDQATKAGLFRMQEILTLIMSGYFTLILYTNWPPPPDMSGLRNYDIAYSFIPGIPGYLTLLLHTPWLQVCLGTLVSFPWLVEIFLLLMSASSHVYLLSWVSMK